MDDQFEQHQPIDEMPQAADILAAIAEVTPTSKDIDVLPTNTETIAISTETGEKETPPHVEFTGEINQTPQIKQDEQRLEIPHIDLSKDPQEQAMDDVISGDVTIPIPQIVQDPVQDPVQDAGETNPQQTTSAPDVVSEQTPSNNSESVSKQKHAGGRPTKMDDETLAKLRQAFLMGFTDREAAIFAAINPATLYRYQEDHKEFCEQKDEWKTNPLLKAKTTIYMDLDRAETARWYLERKAKEEFSTRTEHTGKDGAAIEMTLDALESDYDDLATKANDVLTTAGKTTE